MKPFLAGLACGAVLVLALLPIYRADITMEDARSRLENFRQEELAFCLSLNGENETTCKEWSDSLIK